MTNVAPPGPNAPQTPRREEDSSEALLAALGLDDSFLPEEPRTLEETGLSSAAIEDLILKVVQGAGFTFGKADRRTDLFAVGGDRRLLYQTAIAATSHTHRLCHVG